MCWVICNNRNGFFLVQKAKKSKIVEQGTVVWWELLFSLGIVISSYASQMGQTVCTNDMRNQMTRESLLRPVVENPWQAHHSGLWGSLKALKGLPSLFRFWHFTKYESRKLISNTPIPLNLVALIVNFQNEFWKGYHQSHHGYSCAIFIF